MARVRLLQEDYTGPWSLEDMSLHRVQNKTKCFQQKNPNYFTMHAKFHLNRSHIETNIKLFQYLFASGFDVKLALVDLYILCCYTRLSLLTKLQACSIKRTAFFPATCHSLKNLKNEVLDCIMSLGFGQWTRGSMPRV